LAKKRRSTRSSHDNGDGLFDHGDNGGGAAVATASGGGGGGGEEFQPLHLIAQARYLNYALSVITSRALPDVRDGLKPVHRRILYAMWQRGLTADAKHRKCADVVGTVLGSYHPHGDSSVYDALVRMSQSWIMRVPLIDGSGNFGSMDGDAPAAYRYTECRLTAAAAELLDEIRQQTVHFRPNYDGTKEEPVVLPSKLPNLLINGSSGIAVGMATNIPPHNPGEVCNALLKLMDDPEIKPYQLVANDAIQGPDFPTGGQILNTRDELREIYKTGSGSVRMRATWEKGPATRGGKSVFITAIPYNVNKATLVEQIAGVVTSRKMPLILDVRDVSTDDVRIELVLKKDAEDQKVMAYLFRHTALQTNFNVNLTCLIPTENPEVCQPQPNCDLKTILWHFLHFRLDVVTRRLENELAQLEKRIHILEGFAVVFDALDEIIRIIRKSDGKADAAEKIMARFPADKKSKTSGGGLDAEQTDAILELKLYRLAKLEILVIQEELKEKQKRSREIRKLLGEEEATGRWKLVRSEIEEIRDRYGKSPQGKRRTTFETTEDEPAFTAEDFIVAEDNHVLVTRDGWVKRQKEIADPGKTRLREGDSVLVAEAGSTRATFAFFSNFGTCYTARIIDIPATTGYGEPIQKLFKLKDGERIIAACSMDPRTVGDISEDPKKPDLCPAVHGFAASSDGYAIRFGLAPFVEVSTRAGRRYARPGKGEQIVGMAKVHGDEVILAATAQCRAMVCKADEINYVSGPAKGVQLIKLSGDDRLLGFKASGGDRDLLRVETNRGAEKTISTAKYKVTSRGGKGWEIQKNGRIARILPDDAPPPAILEEQESDS